MTGVQTCALPIFLGLSPIKTPTISIVLALVASISLTIRLKS